MSNPRILICGPRSASAVTGVALAVDLFVDGLTARQLPHRLVDATFRGKVSKSGTFAIGRAVETVCVILMVWWHLFFCQIYYATMSTSSVGFIRDFLTVGFAKLLRRRTVLHLHGGGFEDFYMSAKPWLQLLIRSNLRRTDTIIVLGELLKDQFYCAGDFVKDKLVVVPNGLTLGVEEPPAFAKDINPSQPIRLLYLSSLMPSKGFFDVMQAMRILEASCPGRFKLDLCGSFVDAKTETAVEVSDLTSMNAYISKHCLEDVIHYHGQVLGCKKTEHFAQAHIFLLPTSYPWEGQPLSIIEALAYSTPAISCYHKGIPELIEDGVSGAFVTPRSPEAIAGAIQEISNNPVAYAHMSEAARVHYESNFRREGHLERMFDVLLLCGDIDRYLMV